MNRSIFAHRGWRLYAGAALLLIALAACKDSTGNDNEEEPTGGPPVITSLSHNSADVGGADFTLTIDGQRFTDSSFVIWNDFAIQTTYVSSKQLRAQVRAWMLRDPGTARVTVYTPGLEGGSSEARELAIAYPRPTLTALSIDTASAGRSGVAVTATGTGFNAATVVRYGTTVLPTDVRSGTELRFVLDLPQLANAGEAPVVVENPAPGGGASAPRTFTVVRPTPVVTILPTPAATAGGPGFTLTVHGHGFMPGASVQWNGAARAAEFVTSTRLEVPLSSGDLAAPGTATLRVVNPGVAATSAALTFTVLARPAATGTFTRVPFPAARDLAWDAGTGRIYLSVRSSGGALGNTVAALDPATGSVTGSVFVGSEPGVLARSHDGQYLYVGIDGASAVRRVSLQSLTAGPQWALDPGQVAGDIAVMPGQPTTVAVSRHRPGYSPPLDGVTIYDNGAPRPTSSSGHTGGARIEWLDSPAALYGYNNAHTGFEFFAIGVDASGARHVAESGGLISGFSTDIFGAAGRIYATDGSVVDPERRVRLGTFGGGSAVVPDPRTGRIYVLREEGIVAVDMNTFQTIGTVALPAGVSVDPWTKYRMIRFGNDGVAFGTGSEIVLARSPLFAP